MLKELQQRYSKMKIEEVIKDFQHKTYNEIRIYKDKSSYTYLAFPINQPLTKEFKQYCFKEIDKYIKQNGSSN